MSQKRNQTHTVTLPAGTVAGQYEDNVTLDLGYKRCLGVAVYENNDGGIPNYQIGLRDNRATYQEQTHKNDWVITPDTAPDQRLKSMDLPTDGTKLYIRTVIAQTLTEELSYDIVFKLEEKR